MARIVYQTPGVYIEEVLNGARPIQAVGTRVAGFVGVAPNREIDVGKPVAINNWAEFMRRFASAGPELLKKAAEDQLSLETHFKSARKEERLSAEYNQERKRLEEIAAKSSEAVYKTYPQTYLSHAVYGFFLNGGSRCYVVNVGAVDDENSKPRPISSASAGDPIGLDVLEKIDEIGMVAAPGYTGKSDYEAIRRHCDKLKDRVGILDGPEKIDDEAMKQLSGESGRTDNWTMPDRSEGGYLTLYVPWIEISNPAAGMSGPNERLYVPPCGHIAGIWARNDATRGVHKAPANEIVRGALGLAKQFTHEEQGLLNQQGINIIRFSPNEGFLVWGARTLTKEQTFRYLNVRRLVNMIEESITESTRWIVFEPNDRPLWKAIRRDVTAFLIGFWRDGALMGRTPQEAFYVKCDEETNPIESIRQGKVIIEVGLAPVLPAEFVIFRISQYEAGTEVELQS